MVISDKYADPSKLSSQYRSNSPFPHIVLDDFISKDLLNSVSEEFPDLKTLNHKIEYSNQTEVNEEMGFLSSISDARVFLEKLYKCS